jgi:alpha-beta hydrolase superfamily lysophospholipase
VGGKMKYVRENIEYKNKAYRLHRWMPDFNNYKGMIQVIHGMAEHVNRYSEFAEHFTERGFIVFGIDHLGHGETVKLNNGTFGYFAKEDGWVKVVKANKYISKLMRERHPDLSQIIYGHSMGSIIARYYLIGDKIPDGIILSGVMSEREVFNDIMKIIAKLEKALKNDTSDNVIDNYLMNLTFNWKFDGDDDNSWISSLKDEVDRYKEDDLCDFEVTNQMFIDMFGGLKTIDKIEKNKEISKDISLFIVSGKDDPVSQYGKDVKKLFRRYKAKELKDLKYKVYSNIRHEVLRDRRKEEVYSDFEKWITEHI